jgi:hypothetical protein
MAVSRLAALAPGYVRKRFDHRTKHDYTRLVSDPHHMCRLLPRLPAILRTPASLFPDAIALFTRSAPSLIDSLLL